MLVVAAGLARGAAVRRGLDVGGSGCSGRLVVHVGAHKTGTTSTQTFLHARGQIRWLFETFGIVTGNVTSSEPYHRPGKTGVGPEARPYMKEALRKNRTLFLSDEAFGYPDDATTEHLQMRGLHHVKQYLINKQSLCELRIVLAHRQSDAWIRSQWLQRTIHDPTARNSGALSPVLRLRGDGEVDVVPLSYVNFATADREILKRSAFGTYENVIKGGFPADIVEVFSYDKVLEDGVGIAAHLLCNSTLGLAGRDWADCVATVKQRETAMGTASQRNKSPQPVLVDTLRLVTLVAMTLRSADVDPYRVVCDPTRVADLAKTLPTTCDADAAVSVGPGTMLAALAAEADRGFLARTGALPPSTHQPDMACRLDDGRLTRVHFKAIHTLARGCEVHEEKEMRGRFRRKFFGETAGTDRRVIYRVQWDNGENNTL